MSVLPPKPDVLSLGVQARYVPIADLADSSERDHSQIKNSTR